MKVLIDTNILISAALNLSSTPGQAFFKAVTYPNKGIICEQNLEELKRIFNRKFPNKIKALEDFLDIALTVISVVPIPTKEHIFESEIRDALDRPILRTAISASADVILTGDKDFLESGIKYPRIITASEFIKM